MFRSKIAACAACLIALLVSAEAGHAFTKIERAEEFVSVVGGRELTRTGIRVTVRPDGQITGRAFGRPVSGDWTWKDGYFCRDLNWGDRDLGYNCQMVQRDGTALRFTSDRGQGVYADLWLK